MLTYLLGRVIKLNAMVVIAILSFVWVAQAQATTTLTGTLRYLDGSALTEADCTVTATGTNNSFSDEIDAAGAYSLTWEDDESELYNLYVGVEDCTNAVYNSHKIYLPPGTVDELDIYVDLPEDRAVIRGKVVDDNGIGNADQVVSFVPKQSEHRDYGYSATTDSTGNFNIDIPAGIYNVYADLGEKMDYIRLDQSYEKNTVTDLGTLSGASANGDIKVFFMQNTSSGPEYVTLNEYNAVAYNSTNDLYEVKTKNMSSGSGGAVIAGLPSNSGAWTYFKLNKNEDWTIDIIGLTDNSELVQGTISVPGSALSEEPYYANSPVYTIDIVLNTLYTYDSDDVYEFSFPASEDQALDLSDTTMINIPAYALDDGGETVQVIIEPALDALGIEYPVTGFPYNFTAYDSNGATVETFRRPIEIIMNYDEVALAALGIDEADIEPWYYNEDGNSWRRIPVFTLNTIENSVTFETTHFSQYGLQINRATETDVQYTSSNKKKQLRLKPIKTKNVTVPVANLEAESADVSWKHFGNSNVSGYQVRLFNATGTKVLKTYGVDKLNAYEGKARISHTIRKLSANTQYQVRVRAYKTRKGVSAFGDWSKTVEFRTAAE